MKDTFWKRMHKEIQDRGFIVFICKTIFTYLNTKPVEPIIEEILQTCSEILICMATLYFGKHYT
jgi:hypothetical protein